MNKILNLIFITLAFFSGSQATEHYFVKKGNTDFIIVLSDLPQLVEQTAAKELKTYLDESTKINWIIASEKTFQKMFRRFLSEILLVRRNSFLKFIKGIFL